MSANIREMMLATNQTDGVVISLDAAVTTADRLIAEERDRVWDRAIRLADLLRQAFADDADRYIDQAFKRDAVFLVEGMLRDAKNEELTPNEPSS